jgi:hypothetical protein
MSPANYTRLFPADQLPDEIFNAVSNVPKWWSVDFKGFSKKIDDEFEVRFDDVHYSRQRLIEVIPSKKMVWLVTDSKLNFIEDASEWTGTKINFDISRRGNITELRFTHEGLVPEVECFKACSGGWDYYLTQSLLPLITTGLGKPYEKSTTKKAHVS